MMKIRQIKTRQNYCPHKQNVLQKGLLDKYKIINNDLNKEKAESKNNIEKLNKEINDLKQSRNKLKSESVHMKDESAHKLRKTIENLLKDLKNSLQP